MPLYLHCVEKEKENLCVGFTYSVKQEREIRKFHFAAMQRQLRNVAILLFILGLVQMLIFS